MTEHDDQDVARAARPARTSAARQAGAPLLLLAAVRVRERTRATLRTAFPRRRARTAVVRSGEELRTLVRTELVDGVILDLGSGHEAAWEAAALARDFPAIPFVGVASGRAADGSSIARAASLELADVLIDGVDDAAVRALVTPLLFTSRFAAALADPPVALCLTSPLQRAVWHELVRRGGRSVRTEALAAELKVTREHLSRRFGEGGAPTLKRTIDFVRVLAAAELAKNPGYDVGAVATVLGFASSSHLSSTARRVVETRPSALARLRAADLVARFVETGGRTA